MAYPQYPAQDLDTAYVGTLNDFSSDVEDQTFTNRPALKRLTANKRMTHGGRQYIEERVSAGRNTNYKQIKSDSDTVDFSQQATSTVAYFPMAMAAVPVQRSLLRESINSGVDKVVDLLALEIKQAGETLGDQLSAQLFGDGTDATMLGLDAVAPSSVGSNTFAGIAEASMTWWQSQVTGTCGSFATDGYMGSSDDKLTRAFLAASDNGERTPSLVLSDSLVWQYYHRSLGLKVRYESNQTFGGIGKTTLSLFDADWLWDTGCPAGTAFLLHPEYFKFQIDPNFNYRWLDVNLGKQFLLKGQVLTLRYQLTVNRRNVQHRTSGWTA